MGPGCTAFMLPGALPALLRATNGSGAELPGVAGPRTVEPDVLSYVALSFGRRLRGSQSGAAIARARAQQPVRRSNENEAKKTCASSTDVCFLAESLTGSTFSE